MAIFKDDNKTKDGRTWYFKVYKKDFNGNNKAYKSKKFLTKKEAQEAEATFLIRRDNPNKKAFIIIANDYFNDLEKIKKESTFYSYKIDFNNHIKPFFEKYDISDINVQTIRNWAVELEKKNISVKYMNKIHNILNSIFDFGIKNYGLKENPSRTFGTFKKKNDEIIKDEDKIRYITIGQFKTFINCIENNLWHAFFTFAYYTGCRKGEMQALNWNDINFNTKEITINKTLSVKTKDKYKITSTKNNLNRKIKMNNILFEELLNYRNEIMKYKDFSNKWFIFGNTRFLPQTTIDNNKKKYFLKSGIPEITMHEFRHSHVSLLINEYLKSGQTDTAKFFLMMSNRMGHSIEVMQNTYMHLFPTIQDEIVDLLDNL